MMLKYIAALVFVGIVNAIELQHAPLYNGLIKSAPIAYKTVEIEDGPAEYEFSYSVHDPHTGDIKGQKETRKGDVVIGSYELIDSDGHRRIVQYHADKHSGFNAIVHREPTDIKIPIPEQRKLIAHAPIHKVISSPIVHYASAPTIAKVISPIAKLVGSPAHGTHVSVAAPSYSYHY